MTHDRLHPQVTAAAGTARSRPGAQRTAPMGAHDLLALQRSVGNAAVGPLVQRMRLDQPGLYSKELDSDQPRAIVTDVVEALSGGDYFHIQQVMADLRVKDPKTWVEVDQAVRAHRMTLAKARLRPRETASGQTAGTAPVPIPRYLHRFWSGGPMSETTLSNLLAMQDKVNESQASGTPWMQMLWTSGTINTHRTFFGTAKANPLQGQLAKLGKAGMQVVDVDREWEHLVVPVEAELNQATGQQDTTPRADVNAKATKWTAEAKADMDSKKYEKVKWLSDIVRLVALNSYGGVYLDTDIGPGGLDLRNNELYHGDPAGQIGHHAPPMRHEGDHREILDDQKNGDTPNERLARYTDASVPVLNYFLATRGKTMQLERELARLFQRDELTTGMSGFSRLFEVWGQSGLDALAPPQQRVTPWLTDLAWTTAASQGEG